MNKDKLKVFIVDDESSTRELIKISIDWEALGYAVIGEASNAEEALSFIENHTPDVVLTDICMPYMDGIELSRNILEQYPEIKVMIITGHDDFDYAKESIKLGVVDFILKPIDEDEISETLVKVAKSIAIERRMKNESGLLKKQLEEEKPFLKEKFLVDLLHNNVDVQVVQRRFQFLDIQFRSNTYQVICIEVLPTTHIDDNRNDAVSMYQSYLYVDKIKEQLTGLHGLEIFPGKEDLIVIINSNPAGGAELTRQLEKIKRLLLAYQGITMTIGMGTWCESPNQIKLSYREALEALAYKVVVGVNQIIEYKDMVISTDHDNNRLLLTDNKLSIFIKGGMRDESVAIVDEVFDSLAENSALELRHIRLSAVRLLTEISNAALEIGLDFDISKGRAGAVFTGIFALDTLPQIKGSIVDAIESICEKIVKEQGKKQKSIIIDIQKYVTEHIHEQLSLSYIAEVFHMNKSYLSRIFKDKTQMTIGDYILKERMEKSIALINSTDKKAYEIAAEVGYNDPNYFGISFKKFTGKSISDFRKR